MDNTAKANSLPPLSALPTGLKINPATISTSGFSAGGFMATQMHFIHSSTFKGSAILASGPFTYFLERRKFFPTNDDAVPPEEVTPLTV
mmetsp:Transcript_29887/g.45696  ORF Transcript_29887/g.45696 Transcript_29887/m.45696 type:complete len:89 (-) Transcript_29887:857-1123(-)|eukprot:CAMPEP_0170493304 /NCGR_PEP_ID=MMETSP0208-20121228/13679_1 /TAXON_ID=197538 /ORGANISM="Strombidium inclinatum, Strain S3" /LENGTH=88 /DNA_ID=CAMNT_0010769211 /DNA_START=31 /DNA_END=297 /DNA_ORIENTATION=-